ncbi:IS200/IS605 family transposase [Succinatimonas hippei]|uniref:IS200/IS605 family transposase n=1 Tax=Succinatimonas hippei TaxID=626938 RepID=UPI0026EC7E92|nr:IS200/IS605 family transposase [Succinatimonas hippei]
MRIDKSIRKKLDNNNHSVFSLNYHLVLIIKSRRKVIDDEISEFLKEVFIRIAPDHKAELKEWSHDSDHVHVLFKAQPDTVLSKFINAYKSASSRVVKRAYPELRKHLWKEYFWSRSYCLISAGGASLEVIKEYIEKQGMD